MFRGTYRIAEHVVEILSHYPDVHILCREYEDRENAELTIRVTLEDIAFERARAVGKQAAGKQAVGDGYLETLAVYRKICDRLLEDDVVLFHCSALAMDGRACLFTGPSGVGKSTHARLWRERFGRRVVMINDDKPLLKVTDGEILVYGTPYAGKAGLHANISAPAAGIVVLRQAEENRIRKLGLREAYPLLLAQIYRREDARGMARIMDLTAELARLPVFLLECRAEPEVALMSYRALREYLPAGGEEEENEIKKGISPA